MCLCLVTPPKSFAIACMELVRRSTSVVFLGDCVVEVGIVCQVGQRVRNMAIHGGGVFILSAVVGICRERVLVGRMLMGR